MTARRIGATLIAVTAVMALTACTPQYHLK